MAETPPKRPREDDDPDLQTPKRHQNSYTHYLSIDEQQETTQDFSDFFTSFCSDPFLDLTRQPEPGQDNNSSSNPPSVKEEESANEEDEKERVIRHLLEASDDELGIPSRVDGGDVGEGGGDDEIAQGGYGDFSLAMCDGLWDLEDEAANYYSVAV